MKVSPAHNYVKTIILHFAIGIVYLLGGRIWISIAIGAFAANLMTDGSIVTTLAITCGNTLEAVAGAALIRWIQSHKKN